MIPDATFDVHVPTPPKVGDVYAVDSLGSDERVEWVVLQVKAISSAGSQHMPLVPAYRVFCNAVAK